MRPQQYLMDEVGDVWFLKSQTAFKYIFIVCRIVLYYTKHCSVKICCVTVLNIPLFVSETGQECRRQKKGSEEGKYRKVNQNPTQRVTLLSS